MSGGGTSNVPLLGGKVERIVWITLGISIVLFATAITWANVQNVDIGLVGKRSSDEYAFTLVLCRMYEGVLTLNPRDFFNISFFSYGFPYFFLQLILTVPAQILHSYEAILIVGRSFSLAWAVGTLALAAWWINRRAGSWGYGLAAVWLMIAMPGLTNLSVQMHPDTMMCFFVLAGFVAAAELNPARSRDVIIVGLLCGLGACAKIQIVIYAPFIAMLMGLRVLLEHNEGRFQTRLVPAAGVAASVGLLTPVTYLVLNPFLVKGEALQAFIRDFNENMASNATNQFSYMLPTVTEKLDMLAQYYFPVALLVAVFAALVLAIYWFKCPLTTLVPELSILCCGAVTCIYIFITVHKTWDSYYLASFVLLIVSLLAIAGRVLPRRRPVRIGLGVIAATALTLIAVRTPAAISARIVDDGPERPVSASIVSLVSSPLERVTDPQLLISPYTPFQFQKLGLSITHVHSIKGVLADKQLDDANIIIIRKNDIYFTGPTVALDNQLGEEAREARKRIDVMRANKDNVFFPCGENAIVFVLCRRTDTRPEGQ